MYTTIAAVIVVAILWDVWERGRARALLVMLFARAGIMRVEVCRPSKGPVRVNVDLRNETSHQLTGLNWRGRKNPMAYRIASCGFWRFAQAAESLCVDPRFRTTHSWCGDEVRYTIERND